MTSRSATLDVWKGLLEALMRGSVVPFVGAGISRSARVSSVPAFEPNIESSGYLWRRLRARLARAREAIKSTFQEELCRAS